MNRAPKMHNKNIRIKTIVMINIDYNNNTVCGLGCIYKSMAEHGKSSAFCRLFYTNLQYYVDADGWFKSKRCLECLESKEVNDEIL